MNMKERHSKRSCVSTRPCFLDNEVRTKSTVTGDVLAATCNLVQWCLSCSRPEKDHDFFPCALLLENPSIYRNVLDISKHLEILQLIDNICLPI